MYDMKSKLIGADGMAHTRKDYNIESSKSKSAAYHTAETPKEEIEICLSCQRKECHPNKCTRIHNVCKNCANLVFSDCYGECSKGYISGIVHPYDRCKHFENKRRKSK